MITALCSFPLKGNWLVFPAGFLFNYSISKTLIFEWFTSRNDWITFTEVTKILQLSLSNLIWKYSSSCTELNQMVFQGMKANSRRKLKSSFTLSKIHSEQSMAKTNELCCILWKHPDRQKLHFGGKLQNMYLCIYLRQLWINLKPMCFIFCRPMRQELDMHIRMTIWRKQSRWRNFERNMKYNRWCWLMFSSQLSTLIF